MPLAGIKACVFDAYGTLFDVAAAARRCADALGGRADDLAALWRTKQLEYTWLRSLMGTPYRDFWQVTGDGLDFAMARLGVADAALRGRLMDLYLNLDAYPDAKETLKRLKGSGMATAILSNGSAGMLGAATTTAGLCKLLDRVLSVDEVDIYKPHPSVYQLACDHLGVAAGEVCFVSSNGWDIAGASWFGFQCVWINRAGQPPERLPGGAQAEIRALADLPPLLGL
ncbi:MAG: haloacid dehalogenase type II [Magnetospirillum sp. WYHS-4]